MACKCYECEFHGKDCICEVHNEYTTLGQWCSDGRKKERLPNITADPSNIQPLITGGD